MKRRKNPQTLRPLKQKNSDDIIAANIAERQVAVKKALFSQASIIGNDAPVGMVCVFVYQDGRTSTMLTNIEPEHLPLLSAASARLRQKLSDFFFEVNKNSAKVHPFKRRNTD